VNFSPLDLQLENYTEMPDVLLHPHHLQLLRRFLCEWNRYDSRCSQCFDELHIDVFGKNCMHESGVLHAAQVVGMQFDDLFT